MLALLNNKGLTGGNMNDGKLETAMLHTLESAGSMDIMRLAKFMYLADYTYARTFGNRHGFIDEHQRYKFGPVPAGFYRVYNKLLGAKVIARNGNQVNLTGKKYSNQIQLTEEELACVDKIIDDFEGVSLTTVKNTSYKTEPMIEILEEEKQLNSGIIEFRKIDFTKVKVHPLMKPIKQDLSYMDTREFKESLA